MPKKILLLINPKARSGSGRSEEVILSLHEAGHEVIQPPPQEDVRKFILEHKDDADLVVVGGGDGTINYVLSALVESQLPLIIFPMGTANLFARSFNIKADIEQLIDVTRTGISVPIDLGMVNGIYFINVCGLGISTEVNKSVPAELKKITGPFSFWIQGLRLIRHLNPFKIILTIDDKNPLTVRTWQITICNGKKYAAWMTIQPDASYDDDKLRCLSTEITNWWQVFSLLPAYIKGTYRESLDVSFKTGKKIKLESKRPLAIDVDGDVQTTTPAVFEVKSKVLNIILPAQVFTTEETPISDNSLRFTRHESFPLGPEFNS